jgi:hypothetical protein
MAVVLLGVPIIVATFFLIILVIFIVIILFEYRRNRWRFQNQRFEDDNNAYAEEVAETYMRLLEPISFNKSTSKYPDCSICLREFEDGEQLQRIPNCSHVFHEACLRKWFVQAQICPTCRGNIIRMPSSGDSPRQHRPPSPPENLVLQNNFQD